MDAHNYQGTLIPAAAADGLLPSAVAYYSARRSSSPSGALQVHAFIFQGNFALC